MNLIKALKKINCLPFSRIDVILYLIIVVFCYFSFQHSDILHTGGCSFSYLNGNVSDFYDVNRELFNASPFQQVNYLPSTYILFALWNLPLKLLGIVGEPTFDVGYAIFWYKLLPAIFLILAAIVFLRLSGAIGLSKGNARLATCLWLSSPILVFSQFIFGQYDIFAVLFMLLGLYFYFEKRLYLFTLFFGIAITFKYFPVFIYVPLLVLSEKRIPGIVRHFLILLAPYALEVIPYLGSPAFRSEVLGWSILDRLLFARVEILQGYGLGIFLFIWFIICFYAFIKRIDERTGFFQLSIFICTAVFGALFTLVFWHPQWLLFITPFLALSTFMSARRNEFLLLDLAMMYFFVAFLAHAARNNVDQSLLMLGAWRELLAASGITESSQMIGMAKFLIPSNKTILLTFFSASLAANVFFKLPFGNIDRWEYSPELSGDAEFRLIARLRFYGGIMIFVIPAMTSMTLAILKG